MPESDRNVQPYIYLSTYPKDYAKKILEPCTDEYLYDLAIKGKKLRKDFELAMVETSIDCSVHHKSLDKEL